jgi:hypothetical protein
MCISFGRLNKLMRTIWCGAGVLPPHNRIKYTVAFTHVTCIFWFTMFAFLIIGTLIADQMYNAFLSTTFQTAKCNLNFYVQYSSPYSLSDSGFERGYCVHLFNVNYLANGVVYNSTASELTFIIVIVV